MAWPPPSLPTNRTNATPQQNTHPADHNAQALAINDTVGYLTGTLPGEIAAASAQMSMNGGALDAAKGPLIQTWMQTYGSDVNGHITVGFQFAFASTPVAVVAMGANTDNDHRLTFISATTTGATFLARNTDGTGAASTPVTAMWIAVGRRP